MGEVVVNIGETIVDNQFSLFIGAEVLSFLCILLFFIIRYAFQRIKLSMLFLYLFIISLMFEMIVAGVVYKQTGDYSTLQIIVFIFVFYAGSFGIYHFKKLDIYIKQKMEKWTGISYLTRIDMKRIALEKNPNLFAKKTRTVWYLHFIFFLAIHSIIWLFSSVEGVSFTEFFTELSWLANRDVGNSPIKEEILITISSIWIIVLKIDTVISWSYTFFPKDN